MAKAKPRRSKPATKKPISNVPAVQASPNKNLQSGITNEIAVADVRYGLANAGFFIQRRYNPDELIGRKGLRIYSQMRRDEQVKAALYTKKLATIASGWEISVEDKELQKDKQLDEIKRFIEFNFREMQGTVESYLLNCLTALDYGYSVTEPVYKEIEYGEWEGSIGLKRLKVIRPDQIDFEMDQFGNIMPDGILQAARRMPINRFAIFSYRSEFGNPFGDSDLREAYRPWFVKDTVIKFMGAALERFGAPIAIASTAQTLDDTTRNMLRQMLDSIQNRTGIIIPDWVKIEFPMPIQRPGDVFTGPLDKLDQWLAMSILMPSLLGMGGGQQKVGSLARSQTEFDTFLWVVENLRNEVAETVINEQIVKVLVDLNFEVDDGIYPKFKFKELTHERKLEILDLYNKALAAQAVTKTREDEEHYRSLADFPELPDEAVASGTREAQEQSMKDQVAQAGKMAKIAPPAPPGGGGGFPPKKPGGFPPKKPVPKKSSYDEQEEYEYFLIDREGNIIDVYHLPGQHDQSDHGNRGGQLAETAIENGGFTYNPVRLRNRQAPRKGFAVAFDKSTEKAFSVKIGREQLREKIVNYVKAHRDQIKEKGNYLGGWYDKDRGRVFLDISKVLPDKTAAMELAKKAKQAAIFDLAHKQTLKAA